MEYTWAVWQRNRLVGYVIAASEWNAIRSAKYIPSQLFL